MTTEIVCGNCRFFQRNDPPRAHETSRMGECHRHTPPFPFISEGDWCAEADPMTPPSPAPAPDKRGAMEACHACEDPQPCDDCGLLKAHTPAPGGPCGAPDAPTTAVGPPDGPVGAPDPGHGAVGGTPPGIIHEYLWEVTFDDGRKIQVKGEGIAAALQGFDNAEFEHMRRFDLLCSLNTGFRKEGA